MADTPDFLTLQRNRDGAGRHEVPLRRAGVVLLGALLVAGLLNAFGQRPHTTVARTAAAALHVYSPSRLRSGLLFESRFTIEARRELRRARLVLDSGWLEGMTVNTIEPAPVGEASDDGKLLLELGHVRAGRIHRLFVQLQVNPTNLGRRRQDVELYDGDRRLLRVERSVTIFP